MIEVLEQSPMESSIITLTFPRVLLPSNDVLVSCVQKGTKSALSSIITSTSSCVSVGIFLPAQTVVIL